MRKLSVAQLVERVYVHIDHQAHLGAYFLFNTKPPSSS